MIRFLCPRCKAVLDQPENAAGTKLPCPSCGQRLQVPLPPENKTVLGTPLGADVPITPSAVPAALPAGGAAPPPEIPAPVTSSTHVQVRLVMGREHLFWPCPYCQNSVDVPQDLGQVSVRCPHCAKKIEVPYPSGMPRRARRPRRRSVARPRRCPPSCRPGRATTTATTGTAVRRAATTTTMTDIRANGHAHRAPVWTTPSVPPLADSSAR